MLELFHTKRYETISVKLIVALHNITIIALRQSLRINNTV